MIAYTNTSEIELPVFGNGLKAAVLNSAQNNSERVMHKMASTRELLIPPSNDVESSLDASLASITSLSFAYVALKPSPRPSSCSDIVPSHLWMVVDWSLWLPTGGSRIDGRVGQVFVFDGTEFLEGSSEFISVHFVFILSLSILLLSIFHLTVHLTSSTFS